MYPPTYDFLLRAYEPVKAGQARLVDLIVGFIDPNAPDVIAQPQNPTKVEVVAAVEKADEDEEGEEEGDSEEEAVDTGPDPVEAAARFASIAKLHAAGARLDRQARRQGSEDAAPAQAAGRRVHGAAAVAAHVRCADPQPAHARRRGAPAREGDHGHRGARCRHAAQGFHRLLPQERDQPALAQQARQGRQEVLRTAGEVQGRDRAAPEEARAARGASITSPSTTSRTSTARCRSARPRRAAPRRRWSRPTCAW